MHLGGFEVAGQRPILSQTPALGGLPRLGRQLRGLTRPDLGTEEDRLERHIQSCERQACGARLRLSASREPPLGVGAGAVRLCLRVA